MKASPFWEKALNLKEKILIYKIFDFFGSVLGLFWVRGFYGDRLKTEREKEREKENERESERERVKRLVRERERERAH